LRDGYRADLRKYVEERMAYYDYDTDKVKFKANREELIKTATAMDKND